MIKDSKAEVLSMRLKPSTVAELGKLASEYGTTRTELIRSLLDNAREYYPLVRAKKMRQNPVVLMAEEKLAEGIVDNLPFAKPEELYLLGAALAEVAKTLLEVGAAGGDNKDSKKLKKLVKEAISKPVAEG